ncbi:MAG: hypothetical protein LBI77_04255 [Puniceicoccales bacterium]|nr:hypothetical protein [Puniceicoccales bacterium]
MDLGDQPFTIFSKTTIALRNFLREPIAKILVDLINDNDNDNLLSKLTQVLELSSTLALIQIYLQPLTLIEASKKKELAQKLIQPFIELLDFKKTINADTIKQFLSNSLVNELQTCEFAEGEKRIQSLTFALFNPLEVFNPLGQVLQNVETFNAFCSFFSNPFFGQQSQISNSFFSLLPQILKQISRKKNQDLSLAKTALTEAGVLVQMLALASKFQAQAVPQAGPQAQIRAQMQTLVQAQILQPQVAEGVTQLLQALIAILEQKSSSRASALAEALSNELLSFNGPNLEIMREFVEILLDPLALTQVLTQTFDPVEQAKELLKQASIQFRLKPLLSQNQGSSQSAEGLEALIINKLNKIGNDPTNSKETLTGENEWEMLKGNSEGSFSVRPRDSDIMRIIYTTHNTLVNQHQLTKRKNPDVVYIISISPHEYKEAEGPFKTLKKQLKDDENKLGNPGSSKGNPGKKKK